MYFGLQVTTANGQTTQAVYRFDTIEAARSNYHYFLSSCYSNNAVTYALAMIVNATGTVIEREMYDIPTAQEESEEE